MISPPAPYGSPFCYIFCQSWQAGFSSSFTATVDAVILGQFAGKAGLAAIDSIYNLLKLPVNFFTGLSAGATIIISQCFGAKEESALSKAVHTAVAFSMAGGLMLSAVCVGRQPPWDCA